MEGTDSDSSDEELYVNYYLSRKHVVLEKSCLLRAIDTILQSQKNKSVGRKSKIESGCSAQSAIRVESCCMDRSHLPFCSSRIKQKTNKTSLMPIVHEMRSSLLACDWDSYKELLLELLNSPNILDDYILFVVRSCFVLMLNHPYRTPQLLDNFIASCLRINDESRKLQYLKDCFSLKGDSACKSRENILKDEIEEEDEEEIFFNPDFSSDEDD